MHSFDQLDVSALAVGEHLSRWVIQTELAVERNPLQPDFSGLDIIEKERASIWKQERLYNQERRQLRGGKGGRGGEADDSTDEDEGGKGRRKKKKKKKGKGEDKPGAAEGGAGSSK